MVFSLMEELNKLKKQLNLINPKLNGNYHSLPSLSKIYIPILLLIFVIWLLDQTTDISAYELVADPTEVGLIRPYMGFVSQIGILFFCSAVAICFFTACLIDKSNKVKKKWSLFLKLSGYFLLILLLDDLFRVHEHFPVLLFGTEADIAKNNRKLQDFLEMIVFGIYGSLLMIYIVYFRKLIYRTKFSFLVWAFIFLGISLIIDFAFVNHPDHFLIEEAFKLLGIVTLVIYYIRLCYEKLITLFASTE